MTVAVKILFVKISLFLSCAYDSYLYRWCPGVIAIDVPALLSVGWGAAVIMAHFVCKNELNLGSLASRLVSKNDDQNRLWA